MTLSFGCHNRRPALRAARWASLPVALLLLICAEAAQAQTPSSPAAASQTSQTAAKPASHTSHPAAHRHAAAAKPKAPVALATVVAPPPAPPAPNWPVNASAVTASVGWNGHDLSISASNSSLQQILRDVSHDTGLKVEGLGGDQRIFGNYGPAEARDVLSKLLEGSGYNVMMVGDQGQGAPRELVLTAKTNASNSPRTQAQAPQNDDDSTEDTQPQPPPPVEQPAPPARRSFGPPGQGSGPRTPQEMLQEMQQRQNPQQNPLQGPSNPDPNPNPAPANQ